MLEFLRREGMGVINIVGNALDRLESLRVNDANIEAARSRLEREKQAFELDKKISAAKLDRELLDGNMTRNDYAIQTAAMKEFEKQQKAVIDGGIAQNDMAQHATVKEGESLSSIVQKLGPIAVQEQDLIDAEGEPSESAGAGTEELVPGGYQASILGSTVKMPGGHFRPRLQSDPDPKRDAANRRSITEQRRTESIARRDDLDTSNAIADIEDTEKTFDAAGAKRAAARRLGSRWKENADVVGVINKRFGPDVKDFPKTIKTKREAYDYLTVKIGMTDESARKWIEDNK
jgi:hypothetical protein